MGHDDGSGGIANLIANNRKWSERMRREDPGFFGRLATAQSPNYLWIGCSDSRVPANQIIGLLPGEIFVHRNVANVVIATDDNLNAVVQYAVEHLEVKHVVVCGHYECGGVKAAMSPSDLGQLNSWLQSIRDVYRIHRAELDSIADGRRRFDRLVELHVYEQCLNVLKIDHVQRAWYKTRTPEVHGWVFDVRTGKLVDLGLDMEAEFAAIRGIYDLRPTS